MSIRYRIVPRRDIDSGDVRRMHRLRAQVFRSRLNWSVTVSEGLEFDEYDTDDALYMLMHDDTDELCGCWRILPTLRPYMLADTFPQLLGGHDARRDARVCELSRFVVDTGGGRGFGFSEATRGAMREVVRWALHEGVQEFVTVTSTAVERLLRHLGVECHRYAPAALIGNTQAVALRIALSDRTLEAVLGRYLRTA